MPNSLGNVALGLFLPSASTQDTGSATLCTDPLVGACQGFVGEPRTPLEAGAPPVPPALLSFPLLSCAFIPFTNSVCQTRLHSWLCSTCLFSMPARRSPAPLALWLRGGGSKRGGEQGWWGGKQEQAAAFPSPYLFKA